MNKGESLLSYSISAFRQRIRLIYRLQSASDSRGLFDKKEDYIAVLAARY